ncbi:ZIP family metal transporter [Mesobacillus subterraneus]|uniref:ZIP family metal transporter n=1 Tax=Mesobacillus subterraneus TaxID=285983 RepID=UPI001CFE864B|nr:ZIP family metal transporter [Mesobacillus subterraneus]WLR56462.1 ZIP family metal transporter [Mesobacillus subterraneus]
MLLITFILAAGFVSIHLFSRYVPFLDNVPRSRLLSAAGGISVAYVFIHLLPELNKHNEVLDKSIQSDALNFFENHTYIVAMLGLAIFYGLERMVKNSKKRQQEKNNLDRATMGVFWIHIVSFFLYNSLIGYLLLDGEQETVKGLVFYFIALAVHFITSDHALREAHKEIYDRIGRWLLAGAIVIGWAIGLIWEVDESIIAVLFALLAGGVILNVMKEELPEERESNFWAFAAGLAGYTFLLMLA